MENSLDKLRRYFADGNLTRSEVAELWMEIDRLSSLQEPLENIVSLARSGVAGRLHEYVSLIQSAETALARCRAAREEKPEQLDRLKTEMHRA